jgi:hypothetical protein
MGFAVGWIIGKHMEKISNSKLRTTVSSLLKRKLTFTDEELFKRGLVTS